MNFRILPIIFTFFLCNTVSAFVYPTKNCQNPITDSSFKPLVTYRDSTTFDQFTLINCKTSKNRQIDSCEEFAFNYTLILNDSAVLDVYARGIFASIQNDTLELWVHYASWDYMKNHYYFQSESLDLTDSMELLQVPINDLEYFTFTKGKEMFLFKTFVTAYVAGIVNLLVGAPLESIDYKNNTFNFKTYKKMLLYSAGAIVYGAIGSALTVPKSHDLIFLPEEGYGRKCWILTTPQTRITD